jgi:hypothetical protein
VASKHMKKGNLSIVGAYKFHFVGGININI